MLFELAVLSVNRLMADCCRPDVLLVLLKPLAPDGATAYFSVYWLGVRVRFRGADPTLTPYEGWNAALLGTLKFKSF
jgi:hypothetical protein